VKSRSAALSGVLESDALDVEALVNPFPIYGCRTTRRKS
jgi:hypothetical protein